MGAWHAIRKRVANMDLLIALGTGLPMFTVLLLSFPEVLRLRKERLFRGLRYHHRLCPVRQVYGRNHQRKFCRYKKTLDLRPQTAHVLRRSFHPPREGRVGMQEGNSAESVMVDEIVIVRPEKRYRPTVL